MTLGRICIDSLSKETKQKKSIFCRRFKLDSESHNTQNVEDTMQNYSTYQELWKSEELSKEKRTKETNH